MGQSVFGKLRTIVLGNVHDLLNKTIDLNSVSAVRQHIRDLEDALAELDEAAVTASGTVRSVTRERDALTAQAAELDRCIEILLTDDDPGNDAQALPLQARLDGLKERLAAKEAEFAAAQKEAGALNEAASQLRAKHASMVEQVHSLEAIEQSAKAKERAADAIAAAGRAATAGADVSVDDIKDRLLRRADIADEKFTRAMGDLGSATGKDVALAKAAAALAERKAALAAKKAAAAGAAPAAPPAAPEVPATPTT